MATRTAVTSDELTIAWLSVIIRAGFKRRPDDPLPFCIVRQVTGDAKVSEFLDRPLVSVHTLCPANDPDAALVTTTATHDRMLELNDCPDVTLLDGRIVSVEWMDVAESPIWVDYQDDSILRKVGRYQLGLTLVTA